MLSQIPDKLFVFELANNHMGSVEHGLRIIQELATVSQGFPFSFAIKLQYRHLETFIHKDFAKRDDIKYIKRFSETNLTREQRQILVGEIKKQGFISICTPFDESSVQDIIDDEIDILKIGSCSFTDWPLLECAVQCNKPLILSTAATTFDEIDNVVGFLNNRKKDFALMHCVAEYPTSLEHLQLNQIDVLKERYPQIRIGYSTHENPEHFLSVALAIAKGCTIFEKHVGIITGEYGLNDYSATPTQVRLWLETAKQAFTMLGTGKSRSIATQKELDTLFALRRGVFARHDIESGALIGTSDVFLAIPSQSGQITANEWSKYTRLYATNAIKTGAPILIEQVDRQYIRDKVLGIVIQVHDLLKKGNIVIPQGTKLEISHHYGLDSFHEHGATLITVVNREYCKKLIAVLPKQNHPNHYHKKKDETLHVLYGTLKVTLEGNTKSFAAGEMVVIEPGTNHSFTSENGCVFEEISSTHHITDSVYSDPRINANLERKTFVTYWQGLSTFDIERAAKQFQLQLEKTAQQLQSKSKKSSSLTEAQ